MEIIIGKRGGGKTKEIIKRAANYNGYIVCINDDECKRVAWQANQMNIKINFPISFNEFILRKYGSLADKFHIDNVELLLEKMAHAPIETITFTDHDGRFTD